MADAATRKAASGASEVGSRATPEKAKGGAENAAKKAEDARPEQKHVDEVADDAQGEADDAENATDGTVDGTVGDAPDTEAPDADGAAHRAADEVGDAAETVDDEVEDAGEDIVPAGKVAEDGKVVDDDGNVIGKVSEGEADKIGGSVVDQEGDIVDDEGNVIGTAEPTDAEGTVDGAADEARDKAGDAAKGAEERAEEVGDKIDPESIVGPLKVTESGDVTDKDGRAIGKLKEGDAKKLSQRKDIKSVDKDGNLVGEDGKPVGKIELASADEKTDEAVDEAGGKVEEKAEEAGDKIDPASVVGPLAVKESGEVADKDGRVIGKLTEGDPTKLARRKDIKSVDKDGNLVGEDGKPAGKIELASADAEKVGEAAEGAADKVEEKAEEAGDKIDPESIVGPLKVDESGQVSDKDGRVLGQLIDGDAKKLSKNKNIMSVDKDGNLLGKDGKPVGKIELADDEDDEEKPDLSLLEGKKVNKAGNVVDEAGSVVGRVIKGNLQQLIGKPCDAEGKIWDDSGKVIGEAELLPEDERKQNVVRPFEDFPDATIGKEGFVAYDGLVVGKLVEGDAKTLVGKKVDPDGDVVDKNGNLLGKAERYEEPEPEPEPEVDVSELAGKKVNKVGNVVDEHGTIFGKLVEGDPKKLAGRRSDKLGNVWNDSGEIVGKAELVPASERDKKKDGPFADFPGATVDKDGKVVDAKGGIIGRLIEGDAKALAGKKVDEDGDVLDGSGNPLGKAERWEEPEVERKHNPLAGRKVNREGNVVDENGDLIGKLTEGEPSKCTGKEIDEDGDIVDQKGQTVGHATLLEDIPPEPEEEIGPEEQERLKKEKEDRELAKKLAVMIGQALDKVKPVLKNIEDVSARSPPRDDVLPTANVLRQRLDAADRTPKDELDEEKVVKDVKPLIEEGGRILSETNGTIRALDPDGRIQSNAKHKAATAEATPEEYHLAEVVTEVGHHKPFACGPSRMSIAVLTLIAPIQLTENVHNSIERAKRKIEDMPHAKKELNPLWALLTQPLGQIIAAVGLLLTGVLNLVGQLVRFSPFRRRATSISASIADR